MSKKWWVQTYVVVTICSPVGFTVFPRIVSALEYFPPLNTFRGQNLLKINSFHPWLISAETIWGNWILVAVRFLLNRPRHFCERAFFHTAILRDKLLKCQSASFISDDFLNSLVSERNSCFLNLQAGCIALFYSV